MKKIAIVLGLCALALSGCGNPSKEDVCGGCPDLVKDGCELTYDACDDDGDCIEALEDTVAETC